ncbi:MAG: DUF971 domain-containing protein [Azonexus sp.]|nr:DUF971 domain-containing protein [Azonexus sp.]
MAGMNSDIPVPDEVRLHRVSRVLELVYGEQAYRLPAEYLRVYTPSAEARGHAPGQETLQTGKRDVDIVGIEPVGTYALKLVFSDGHDSGLYSWDILYNLAVHEATLWQNYLDQLQAQGGSRDVDTSVRPAARSCGQPH